MRDERGYLRAYFAALKAETTVDAVWTVSARCGKDRHGATRCDRNAKHRATLDERVAEAAHRMRAVRVMISRLSAPLGISLRYWTFHFPGLAS